LALSCCMAGVHIDWLLLVVGVVLTIMLVAMASLEQYSVVLWLFMLVVAGLAAAFFYFKSKRGGSEAN
jgi:general stress protein CsbA